MIRMAQNRLLKGTKLEWKDVLFVGDSIGTDIRTSIENGIDCALVLSGCVYIFFVNVWMSLPCALFMCRCGWVWMCVQKVGGLVGFSGRVC